MIRAVPELLHHEPFAQRYAMSRSGKDPGTRLKSAKGRTASQVRWLTRQINDPYVQKARADGWRSRAAFKLIELDAKFTLLKGVRRVVDLGIAPGGWSQVVRQKAPAAKVVGIDLLPTEPIEGVTIFEMDFMADAAPAALTEALDGAPDLILSDMAANTVGHKQTDHLRTMGLVGRFCHHPACPRRRACRQSLCRRHRHRAAGAAQAQFHHRQTRQAARQPQGFVRMVRDCARLQGSQRGGRGRRGMISTGWFLRESLLAA
jgi:23S rRNA U2552 (ribose-2'-O)-methylase RlmE/FtsJ